MNPEVTAYINNATAEQKEIMTQIRSLLHTSVTGVQEDFKWSRPVFRKNHDFAYLKTAKAYVTLGFFRFEKLNDPDGLLEGTGKDMRHIKIKKPGDINPSLLHEWFMAAAK